MKQYKSHLKVIGFLTGLMIAATFMLASTAHPENFCNSNLGWFDKDMNSIVKIVRTPCEVGDLGDIRHTKSRLLAEGIVAVIALDSTTGNVLSIMTFVIRGSVSDAHAIAFNTSTKFYIYLNGEASDPTSVTINRMMEYIKNFIVEEESQRLEL